MGIIFFVVGLFFGSFFLVLGMRGPTNDNIITGRSRCDRCMHELKWYELIPVLSFIIQGGKCNYCKNKISLDHLLIEIITGLLFLFGYIKYGITYNTFIYIIAISIGLIIFISDLKHMIILDSPLIIGSILILILRYFDLGIKASLYSILSGIVLFIIMFLVGLLGKKIFKKESLGGGDIKLSLFVGILLGLPNVGIRLGIIAIAFSAFLALPYAVASVYLNKQNELPYGPFIIFAAIIEFIFIEKFLNLLIFFMI